MSEGAISNDSLAARKTKNAGLNPGYNPDMERKVFWIVFIVLGVIADVVLPLWWALLATIPIVYVSWWVAYRSDWF